MLTNVSNCVKVYGQERGMSSKKVYFELIEVNKMKKYFKLLFVFLCMFSLVTVVNAETGTYAWKKKTYCFNKNGTYARTLNIVDTTCSGNYGGSVVKTINGQTAYCTQNGITMSYGKTCSVAKYNQFSWMNGNWTEHNAVLMGYTMQYINSQSYSSASKYVYIVNAANNVLRFKGAAPKRTLHSNIQNAIDKAKAKGSGENYESIRYEGYGPGGMAIMIDCLTDNKNRTASFVRSALTKRGGNLGTDGSVSYMFKRKGIIVLDKKYDEDELMTFVLDLDIDDFKSEEDGYVIETAPENFIAVKEALENNNYNEFLTSEVTYVADNPLSLDDEVMEKAISLIETLEDIDDVQSVYHNLDI